MDKIIRPDSFDGFEMEIASLLKMRRNGSVDKDWMDKRASLDFNAAVKLIPYDTSQYEPVHLLAVGDQETYGCNRNGDAFPKQACIDYHKTFEKYAKVYREHKNKINDPSYGIVIASGYNKPMGRIELVVGLDKKSCAVEIEKIASGKQQSFSMSCVLDPTYPVLTDLGYKPISEIRVGDRVFTKEGRFRKVTHLNRRRYTGKAYKFAMNGLPLPLTLTADHPMWAKHFEANDRIKWTGVKATRYFKDPEAFEEEPFSWLHCKHLEIGDRFSYRPVSRIPGYGAISCTKLAALMGYYVAEGSFTYNNEKACTVQYTCNGEDSLIRRVPEIIAELWPTVTVDISPHPKSDCAFNVNVYKTSFAEFIKLMHRSGCRGKIICPEIFNAEDDVKLSFAGAWLDGDGWPDNKGLHWSTVSINLGLQLRDLLASMNIPASIYKIDHSNCETSEMFGSSIEYTVNVSWYDAEKLVGWSEKINGWSIPEKDRSKPSCMRPCLDGTYAYRIKEVEELEVNDQIVYNFEVDEDESYSLAGMISHNCRVPFDFCSICGNQAATRAQYCDHLQHHMTKIASDGRQVCAINTQPLYRDISIVSTPAERIAWSFGMYKAASGNQVISGAELAEQILGTSNLEEISNKIASIMNKMSELQKQIMMVANSDISPAMNFSAPVTDSDRAIIDKVKPIAQKQPNKVFTAMAKNGILLPVRLFSRLTEDKEACLPEGALSQLFNTDFGDLDYGDVFDVDDVADSDVCDMVEPLKEKFGVFPEDVKMRGIMVIDRKPRITIQITKSASDLNGNSLFRKYRSYQTKLAENFADNGKSYCLEAMLFHNAVQLNG